MLDLTILTGPSGSGTTSARFVFEELGYFIVENPPLNSMESVIKSFDMPPYKGNKTLVIFDIMYVRELMEKLRKYDDLKLTFIVLNTDVDVLMERYTLTRHAHPRCMITKCSLENAIKEDYKTASYLKDECDIYIDTTKLTVKELRNNLLKKVDSRIHNTTSIQFTSFGLKYGIPIDIDNFIDVRIIPNPYWVDNLKPLTGLDKPVVDYMMQYEITQKFLDKIVEYLEFTLKEIVKSERPTYNIGIACSGGQHRSTFVAQYLADHFKDRYNVLVSHRDINHHG